VTLNFGLDPQGGDLRDETGPCPAKARKSWVATQGVHELVESRVVGDIAPT